MSNFKQYHTEKQKFDAFDKEDATKKALGSDRTRSVKEGGVWQSNNYVKNTSGYRLTPDDAELNVPTSVQSLDIPDTTTANSMHVESDGDTYWGVNVASGFSAALASISKAGDAIFKSIQVGTTTRLFQISNVGTGFFGDGSDSSATLDGTNTVAWASKSGSTYTMTRDAYLTNLTVQAGVILVTAGYRLLGLDTLTNAGTIHWNGNAGGNATGGDPAGTGGAALSTGYLVGSTAGGTGGTGDGTGPGQTAGSGTSNISNALGFAGGNGGAGGDSSAGSGSAGGTAGTATASNVKLVATWHFQTMLDIAASGSTVKFTAGTSGGGGGGADKSGAGTGGAGGGGGSGGGVVGIYFRAIVNSGTISANGGNGGNGGDASVGGGDNGGGGGGGGGGAGGIVVLAYNTLSNSGSITATAGTGGNGGTGAGVGGTNGTAGSNGTAGTVYQFQVSL